MNQKTKRILLFLSFFLLVATIGSQAYLYHIKTNELLKEQVLLKKEYEELQKKFDTLTSEVNQKEKEKQTLQDTLTKTTQEKEALVAKYVDTVYLTFDDGPSENTIRILDTLKQKNVKATFFPNGNDSDFAKSIYKRIVEEGHAIGNHTYSHNYAYIYGSVTNFKNDFGKLQTLIKETTGVTPSIFRFPGGSNNTIHRRYGPKNLIPSLIQDFNGQGFTYFDWNVDSLDASKIKQKKQVIINAVLNNTKNKKNSIVLFHDSQVKTTTAEALPTIIDALQQQGVQFKVLSKDSFNSQFLK